MPPGVRSVAIGLATAYADVTLQLVRLIDWTAPATCALPGPAATSP